MNTVTRDERPILRYSAIVLLLLGPSVVLPATPTWSERGLPLVGRPSASGNRDIEIRLIQASCREESGSTLEFERSVAPKVERVLVKLRMRLADSESYGSLLVPHIVIVSGSGHMPLLRRTSANGWYDQSDFHCVFAGDIDKAWEHPAVNHWWLQSQYPLRLTFASGGSNWMSTDEFYSAKVFDDHWVPRKRIAVSFDDEE